MVELPAIACSLNEKELKSRTDLASELGRAGLLDVATSGPQADLVFDGNTIARIHIDEFVDAESKCCPFFSFRIEEFDSRIRLEIKAPSDGVELTRGLVAGFMDGWRLAK